MAIKFVLNLGKNKVPHVPIEKFTEIVKRDEILLPETKAILEALKKARQPYVPLPISHCVIISPEYLCTLHKDINPPVKIWTKINWTKNNTLEYHQDKEKFYLDIINLYKEIGYEILRFDNYDILEVEKIVKDLEKKTKKAIKKLEKLK